MHKTEHHGDLNGKSHTTWRSSHVEGEHLFTAEEYESLMAEQPSDLHGCWAAKGPGSAYSRAAICVHAFGGLQHLFIMMIRESSKACFS